MLILNSTSVFLSFISKTPFLGIFSPRLEGYLFQIKLGTQRCSRVLILDSTIAHLNSIPKTNVLVKFSHKTSKYFVLNETWYLEVLKGDDFEFDNNFLKFRPQNTLFGPNLILKLQSTLFQMELCSRR